MEPEEDGTSPIFGMKIKNTVSMKTEEMSSTTDERVIVLPVTENDAILYEPYSRRMGSGYPGIPVHFLTVDGFDPASMGEMWDTFVKQSLEEEIVSDMRLLEPDLDSIHFLTSTGSSTILLGRGKGKRQLPISTYGDGMRRLLALRTSFMGAADGVLLIDKINTGLHWTVMEDMWQFVIKLARQLQIQVFATTHSLDCFRGLGFLIAKHRELADQVSL